MALGHGEAGAEQRHPGAAVGDQPLGGRIADVQDRQAHRGGDLVIDLVRGVGGEQQAVGTGRLELPGGVDQHRGDAVPIVRQLHLGERREVEAFDRQPGAVHLAETLATPRLICS